MKEETSLPVNGVVARQPSRLGSPVHRLNLGAALMASMFEKLEVYQKSVDLADYVASLTGGFPRGYGILVDQWNRAALSIATNLAEGNG